MTQHNFSKSHKIFVGGVSMDAEENDLREYFERYGVVSKGSIFHFFVAFVLFKFYSVSIMKLLSFVAS